MDKEKSGLGRLKSFAAHIWFYYKWHILVGALVALVLGVSVYQTVKNDKSDVSILYIGDFDIGGENRKKLETAVAGFYDDVTGDGRKTLSLTFMNAKDRKQLDNGSVNDETAKRVRNEAIVGDHAIYLVSREYFKILKECKVLAKLEDVLGELPENALDDYGIELKYLDMARLDGFNAMRRDTVVCLRNSAEHNKTEDWYKNNVKLFINLLGYEKEGFVREEVSLILIGDRDLYDNCVADMEESLYGIANRFDENRGAVLNFQSYQLKYSDGSHIFEAFEKETVDALTEGQNAILLLDETVYRYLAEKGALAKVSGLTDSVSGLEYGIKLSSLPLFDLEGFYYADDRTDSRVYLCGTAGIQGYTAEVLGYLYNYK